MPKLSNSEFNATIAQPKKLGVGQPTKDFWSYVADIPVNDYCGHDCSARLVSHVYRMENNNYDHVLINSLDPKVAMTIVVDREKQAVLGHYLLDLTKSDWAIIGKLIDCWY